MCLYVCLLDVFVGCVCWFVFVGLCLLVYVFVGAFVGLCVCWGICLCVYLCTYVDVHVCVDWFNVLSYSRMLHTVVVLLVLWTLLLTGADSASPSSFGPVSFW